MEATDEAAAPSKPPTPPPDMLRELLKVLLGVSSVPADVDEHVSTLFKAMFVLEERCPTLCCHVHVSGVSQSTGKSFFAVVYDAALSASGGARRVIQTIYTALHAELSMTTTAALWRRSLGAKVGAHLDALSLPAGAGTASQDAGVGATPASHASYPPVRVDGRALAAAAGALGAGPNGHAAGAAPPLTPGAVAAATVAFNPAGDADAPLERAAGVPPVAVAVPLGAPVPTGVYFTKPTIFYPSAAAIWCMEALFTVKGKKGWVGIVRGTLTLVRVALLHQYGAACRAFIQGKLPWWPVDRSSRRKVADDRGGVSDQCAHFAFPVAVQGRHLPHGERTRDEDDVDERMVTLTEIYTAKAPNFHLIVALLLILFDKEPCVKTTIVEHLQSLGVTVDPDLDYAVDEALPGLTIGDPRLTDGFPLLVGTPPRPPRTPRTSPPPPTPPSGPSPGRSDAASDDDVGADVPPTARARIEARRRAAAASQQAAALQRGKKAEEAAARATRKRNGAEAGPSSVKKAREHARRDCLDLELPVLDPDEDVVCLPLLAEAEMLAAHTYESLATNWSPPVALLVEKELEVATLAPADWEALKQKDKDVEVVLDENVARSARKLLMQEAEVMRAGGVIHADAECPIVAKVTGTLAGNTMQLSMKLLRAMGDLHVAAERLQAFRSAVAWVKSVAAKYNIRVPAFYGNESTLGELGTEVMRVLLSSNPSATVWRTDARPEDDAEEELQLTASSLVGNMGASWMTDQFLAVNQTILRRWLKHNKPLFYVLPVSFFVPLLSPERGPKRAAAVNAAVTAAAAKAFKLAGAAKMLAGVCNIGNQHWIAFSINVADKLVVLCDSGQSFVSLQEDVAEAVVRVKAMGRRLRVLIDEAAAAKVVEDLTGDALAAGAGEKVGDGVADVEERVAKKSWSQRKVRGLTQTDSYSCGAFAFSFVWHTLRGEKTKVLAADADAVRMGMLAAVVRDGIVQEEDRNARAPPLVPGGADVAMEGGQ